MRDDIHSLLGRYFNGQVTGEEAREVKEWAGQNPDNEAEFRLFQKLWSDPVAVDEKVFDTNKAWNQVQAKIQPSGAKRVSFSISTVIIGVAASLLLILGIWWIAGKGPTTETIVAATDVQVLKLEDGSTVYLRKGSTLEYPPAFAAEERRVTLRGEAFFEVSHNPSRPFIISAAETEIRVLGTSFSVNTANNRVNLVVKTGRVRFSAKGQEGVIVSAGEQASFEHDSFVAGENTDVNFNAWQTGELKFVNTPLEQVASTISDYYRVNLTLSAEDRAQLSTDSVTAHFKNQSLDSVLDELSMITTYGIRKLNDTTYEIRIK